MVFSNIVKKDEMRGIQLKALKEVAEALTMSFGPMGSNTLIIKDNALNRYTKDGYSILKELKLSGSIEHSIVEDLVSITTGIVKELGDNTTSAIIMSYLLFKEMAEMEKTGEELPFDIIENFKKAVNLVSEEVEKNGHECTIDDIYNIAFTSTNGNAEIAQKVKTIYEQYGMDVFIDVSVSNTGEDFVKEYDGLTLDTGYGDTAFINNKTDGISSIRNASIYVFDDPVDTPEMMSFFDAIIAQNIVIPFTEKRPEDAIPTVIMTTRISRDLSAYMEQLIEFMYHTPEAQRPPLLLITNIVQEEQFKDISRMCNCRLIKKYINQAQQEKDIELGLAPTPPTVTSFCGHAELVEASVNKTKFVNPDGMFTKAEKTVRILPSEYHCMTYNNNFEDDLIAGTTTSNIVIVEDYKVNENSLATIIKNGSHDGLTPVIAIVHKTSDKNTDYVGNTMALLEKDGILTNVAIMSIEDECEFEKISSDCNKPADDKIAVFTILAKSVIYKAGEGLSITFVEPITNYETLIQFLEGQIKAAKEDGKDPGYIGGLKRRLNSLKANMVEFLVGGVSASDRDSLRDLVEDAVLNCRSAALNGVGHGANFEGFKASDNLSKMISCAEDPCNKYVAALSRAYREVTELLYTTVYNQDTANKLIEESLAKGLPHNLRTRSFDGLVLTSIKSDIVTLSTISKILGLMITSNQVLVQTPMVNTYYSEARTAKALKDDEEFKMDTPVEE